MITIVTEITTAVAANPENSTVSTINLFLQVQCKYLLADHHLDLEDHLDLLLTRVL